MDMMRSKREWYSPLEWKCSAMSYRLYTPDTPTTPRMRLGDHAGWPPGSVPLWASCSACPPTSPNHTQTWPSLSRGSTWFLPPDIESTWSQSLKPLQWLRLLAMCGVTGVCICVNQRSMSSCAFVIVRGVCTTRYFRSAQPRCAHAKLYCQTRQDRRLHIPYSMLHASGLQQLHQLCLRASVCACGRVYGWGGFMNA